MRLQAAIEPMYPVGGETVPLLRDLQKQVSAMPTLAERIAFFAAHADDKLVKDGGTWRTSRPFVVRFRDTDNTNGPSWNGPWKVFIGKKADLSDARVFFGWQDPSPGPNDGEAWKPAAVHEYRLEIPGVNLEIGTRYYWKISCRRRCTFQCDPNHGCARSKCYAESPVAEFRTEDAAPRWIALEGRSLFNIRDLGRRSGRGGRRVRQGMIYRGVTLMDDSTTGDIPGKSRLTANDLVYLRDELGIKTVLDLRTIGETGGLTVSPLGKDVQLIHRSSQSYHWLFSELDGKQAMAENFRVFCKPANYPIYFHCSGGADRTGSLAWVLHAVLGESRQETEVDWEVTFYPHIPDANPAPNEWRRALHLDEGFGRYGDADTPWDERIILYLKEQGVTDAEIETFRFIMLTEQDVIK